MDKIFKSDKILDAIKSKQDVVEVETIATERFIIFKLADSLFAVSSIFCKEVNSIEKIFYFPHVDPWLKGLVNIRGDVHSIIDLKQVLSLDKSYDEEMQLVVYSEKLITAVAIDNIIDVLDVEVEKITYYKDDEQDEEFFSGLIKYKEKEVVIIIIEKIIMELANRLEHIE